MVVFASLEDLTISFCNALKFTSRTLTPLYKTSALALCPASVRQDRGTGTDTALCHTDRLRIRPDGPPAEKQPYTGSPALSAAVPPAETPW